MEKQMEILTRIDRALESDQELRDQEAVRMPNLADRMSAAGRCYRDRWFSLHGFEMDPGGGFSRNPKLLRVFRLGNAIESEVIALLELWAGFIIKDEQLEVGSGKWVGHIDGLIDMGRDGVPDWCLLEVKSAKAARFELLRELGSYEAWSNQYAAQIHAYLHHLDGITDAIVIVYNKDTSELYAERIVYDLDEAMRLEKESALVTSEGSAPPPRPVEAKTQYGAFCKWCDFNQTCWGGAVDVEFDD